MNKAYTLIYDGRLLGYYNSYGEAVAQATNKNTARFALRLPFLSWKIYRESSQHGQQLVGESM